MEDEADRFDSGFVQVVRRLQGANPRLIRDGHERVPNSTPYGIDNYEVKSIKYGPSLQGRPSVEESPWSEGTVN